MTEREYLFFQIANLEKEIIDYRKILWTIIKKFGVEGKITIESNDFIDWPTKQVIIEKHVDPETLNLVFEARMEAE
jgi:hypothetical protein